MGTLTAPSAPAPAAAAAAGAPRKLRSVDPATLEPLGEVEVWDADRVAAAAKRAREAFPAWAALSFAERNRYLARAKEIILAEADAIAELVSRECGKTVQGGLVGEVFPTADVLAYFIANAERFLARERLGIRHWAFMGRRSTLVSRPIGLVGVISPWNFPFFLSLGSVVMGLVAGNVVILKPSEVTPLVGEKIGDIFRRAGLPEGVFQVASGDGATGAALVRQVDKLFFIGSDRTGRRILEAAAARLTPVVLELGGNAPALVLEDADLDFAARGIAWGAFWNSGQICASVQRIYVAEKVKEPFLEKLLAETKKLRQGPDRRAVDIGSLTCDMQMRVVEDLVEDAKKNGAKILLGGRRRPDLAGLFYEPTLVTDVPQTARIVQEEIFGPVAVALPFSTEEEALRLANDSRFGLTGSVWTRDLARGERLAERIECGSVTVNDHAITAGMADVPWGGQKQSGFGAIHSRTGLFEFVQRRHIHVNRWTGLPVPWWFPESPGHYDGMKALTEALAGDGVWRRLKAALRALRRLRR